MPEFPPGRGTVCLCGFINLCWNSDQASKNSHRKKRQTAPEVDEGTCRQGQIFLTQPLIGPKTQQVERPNMLERPVDVAICRVKDEPPAQRGERGWSDKGNEHRTTEETLPPGGTLQKQGQSQAKDTFKQHRRDGKNNRVAYGLEENIVLQDVGKIFQANPVPRFTNHAITETEPESQEKRIDNKRRHDDDRRQDKAIPIEVWPQSPAPPTSNRLGRAHVDKYTVGGFRNRHPIPLYAADVRLCIAECGHGLPPSTIHNPLAFTLPQGADKH